MTHVLVAPERAAFLRERIKKLLAERQAGKEAVERIVAGEPRSSFGEFTLSFEEIMPDIGRLGQVAGVRRRPMTLASHKRPDDRRTKRRAEPTHRRSRRRAKSQAGIGA
jgi:hypothetical protein